MMNFPIGVLQQQIGGSLYGNDFVLEMATTGSAETITIPCKNVGTFNAVIDWGDETTSDITSYNDGDLAHEYADAGDHEIRISGAFPNIFFNGTGDKNKLKRVLNIGDTGFTDLIDAFKACVFLTSVTSESANTSGVTTFHGMFHSCGNMVVCEVGLWDTSSAVDMSSMFNGCEELIALDVSGFDFSSYSGSMSYMFNNCALLGLPLDVSSWDTSGVINMERTFENCDLLTDIRIDLWNIEACTVFVNFMNNHTGLTTERYDATLIAWAAQTVAQNEAISFGGSLYTGGGAAEAARTSLVNDDGWTIVDGGEAP